MELCKKRKNKIVTGRNKAMKKRRLKALAVAIALTVIISPMATTKGVSGVPAVTVTVEAATKKLSLKASNKKAYVGKNKQRRKQKSRNKNK